MASPTQPIGDEGCQVHDFAELFDTAAQPPPAVGLAATPRPVTIALASGGDIEGNKPTKRPRKGGKGQQDGETAQGVAAPAAEKAKPVWSKAEEIAAFRAAWAASSEWGSKNKKFLNDMAAKNYPAAVDWMTSNGLWVKRYGDTDFVTPQRSIELRCTQSQRVWFQ